MIVSYRHNFWYFKYDLEAVAWFLNKRFKSAWNLKCRMVNDTMRLNMFAKIFFATLVTSKKMVLNTFSTSHLQNALTSLSFVIFFTKSCFLTIELESCILKNYRKGMLLKYICNTCRWNSFFYANWSFLWIDSVSMSRTFYLGPQIYWYIMMLIITS